MHLLNSVLEKSEDLGKFKRVRKGEVMQIPIILVNGKQFQTQKSASQSDDYKSLQEITERHQVPVVMRDFLLDSIIEYKVLKLKEYVIARP